jgi:hypothetical protein
MILWVYSYLCQADLWIGAFVESNDVKNAIAESGMVGDARLEALKLSTLSDRPFPKEIVNILTHEDDLSIKELKKNKRRLTFFIDKNLTWRNLSIPRVIVCLSYFVKKAQRTDAAEIKRARQQRDAYLYAKKNNTLQIVDINEKGD